MLMLGQPKRLATVIVASKDKGPKSSLAAEVLSKAISEASKYESKESKPEPNDVDAYQAAVEAQAKAVLKAISKEDPARLAIALKNFITMCRENETEDELEEEGED